MHKVILIAAFLLASPALADPMPVRMVGSCPAGYAAGVDWCVPMPGTTREAVERIGHCPAGWVASGAYCLGPEKRPATRSLFQMLQDRFGAAGW
jgi:hypothetical protein